MKNLRFLSAFVLFTWAVMLTHPVLGQENQADTLQTEKAKVDTIYVE